MMSDSPPSPPSPSHSDSPDVECPVCYQEYDQLSKLPRMLDCLHVFCSECLLKIQPSPEPESGPCICCPLCRRSTFLRAGDAHSLPCSTSVLAQIRPASLGRPGSVSARLATVTQRLVFSLGERDTRVIVLPTVSLRVERMGAVLPRDVLELRRHRKTLMCVQALAVVFWIMFVLTCVVGVVFGPSLFHN